MTPRSGWSRALTQPRRWAVLALALVFIFAMTSLAVARVDQFGGASQSVPYAPYTAGPVVPDERPYAPYTAGPVVPEVSEPLPYAPYTAGPVVPDQTPYAPYTAGPVVPEVEPYAPYTAGPVVPEE
jgi:hypothetical protein